MKRGILFFGITLILLSCSLQQTVSEHFEGKLIYSIESPGNIPDEKDSINYQVVYAKDTMLRIDSYTQIGKQTYIKHIPKNKAYILMDLGVKKVAIQTIQDTLKNDDRYIFKKARGKKKFAGRKANNINVTDNVFDTTMTMNYLEEVPSKYSTAIKGMPGLPVNYSLNVDGLWTTYKLKEIEEKTLSIDLFGIPSNYEIITLDEF